ncbi:MAG: hypothetical protein Q4B63_03690 [Clostridium perfringens]|nr:hypothetical protein [Clostridium perfringens]
MHFINTVIFKIHKDKIEKGLIFLNRISISKVNKIIAEECHQKSLKYSVLNKKNNEVTFKIKKRKKVYMIKYHKTLAVNKLDYNNFLDLYNRSNAKKAYYITTGVFFQDVYNANYNLFSNKPIILVDGINFITRDKKFYLSKSFSSNNLSFKRYFPKF